MKNDSTLEERIKEWKDCLLKHHTVQAEEVKKYEDYLRNHIKSLNEAGLDEDEAFIVALKRMGKLGIVPHRLAIEYSERLWKRILTSSAGDVFSMVSAFDVILAVGLAIAAAFAIKIPSLFGLKLSGPPENTWFYLRNLSLFSLPFLALFLALKHKLKKWQWLWLAIPFLTAGLVINLFPFRPASQTQTLVVIHLPIALWLTVCYAYAGGKWRDHEQRMNYIRFSGEWFIYYMLIGFGGAILMSLTLFIFGSIGLNMGQEIQEWMLPCGAMGAVVISAWLVEHKKSVVENIAPILTWLFTPLFLALLIIFVMVMLITGSAIKVQRGVLIGFDILLVLVLGLLIYAISARNPQRAPGWFDILQLALVIFALIVDVLALWAMVARISEFGFSPNKTAALGMNLLLLMNLIWSAVLYMRFIKGHSSFKLLELWQTAFLPVFAIWAWFVALFFPVIFNYS